MKLRKKTWRITGWIAPLLLLAGCGLGKMFFGSTGEYLVYGTDALILPGETVVLEARIQKGDFLSDQAGVPIEFYRQGSMVKRAVTDAEGIARMSVTIENPGDYFYQARIGEDAQLEDLDNRREIQAQMMIRCRPADARLMIVDLDKTVVASGFQEVLVGDPVPMADAASVLRETSQQWDVVYLTHRPEYFRTKSRRFLEQHGFPTGPLLLSELGSFIRGSGAFKRNVLQSITSQFGRVEIGVGDKFSDVEAYHAFGLRPYLILPDRGPMDQEDLEDLLADLEKLPDEIQAVDGWKEVRRGLLEGQEYPVIDAIRRLRTRLSQRRQSSGQDEDDDEDD
jgi:hypothetical protein